MAEKKPDVIVENEAVYLLRPGLAVYVKTADICRLIGKSNQWVGQLVSRGTLHKKKTPHGIMFELSNNMQDYCAMLDARAEPEKSDADLKRENAKSAAEITLKAAKATIAQLEAAELQGKMHRSEDEAAMTEELIFTMRNMLAALPGRLAVDVAAAESAAEAADIIRREVHSIMAEIAKYRYDPAKYEERVRERKKWEVAELEDDEKAQG